MSALSISNASAAHCEKFLDSIQSDLRVIANESKKKLPFLKEAAEAGIVKIRSAASRHQDLRSALLADSDEVFNIFIAACETNHPKMVQTSLASIQKLLTFECLKPSSMVNLMNCLWVLMESSVEELKLLQTIMLAVSTNSILTGEPLAKAITLCLRLNFTKNVTVNNAASATVRQLVLMVFERLTKHPASNESPEKDIESSEQNAQAAKTSEQLTLDAYNLLNDLILMADAREPEWLIGLTEMTRSFSLELLETVFATYPQVFLRFDHLSLLVKRQMCPLIIKLLSPGLIKFKSYHQSQYQAHFSFDDNNGPLNDTSTAVHRIDSTSGNSSAPAPHPPSPLPTEKPFDSISIRLLRIVSILTEKFYPIIPTEDEVFISLLIKLSQESFELVYTNRDPSLISVAKLLENSLINLPRLPLIWVKLTSHLTEVCKHPHSRMREWAAETLSAIVLAVFTSDEKSKCGHDESDNLLPKSAYLEALANLSSINFADIRQKQLEVTLQVIQSYGDSLEENWPCILSIASSINSNQNEALIRLAFQCLQIIISDYLQVVPLDSFCQFIDATAKFASQTADINVSLTAVGLIWNLADFFFQNETRIRSNLTSRVPRIPFVDSNDSNTVNGDQKEQDTFCPYESLWLYLFTRLSQLCIDDRPAVRKSSSQTLFGAFATHSSTLSPKIWQSIVWDVLFPLMRLVVEITVNSSDEKIEDSSKSLGSSGSDVSIMLHHSRNTVYKQWSETHVITLNGISIVFSTHKHLLQNHMHNFNEAWKLILYHIESSATSCNVEISEASLACFKLLIDGPPVTSDCQETAPVTNNQDTRDHDSHLNDAWETWCRIGEKIASLFEVTGKTKDASSTGSLSGEKRGTPCQSYLTSYLSIFCRVFPHVRKNFSLEQFHRLSRILLAIVKIPVDSTTEAYLVTVTAGALESSSPAPLTPLQEAVFTILNNFIHEFTAHKVTPHFDSSFLPPLFRLLLILLSFSSNCPSFAHPRYFDHTHPVHVSMRRRSHTTVDPLAMNFVPLGECALRSVVSLYQNNADQETVVTCHVLRSIIQALRVPLALKYKCPSQSTWKLAVNSLITVLKTGLPVIIANGKECIWADLAGTLEEFLFPSCKAFSSQTLEDQQLDESYDVKIVEFVRDCILPHASQLPKEFVLQIVSILNKGSIHSATASSPVDLECNRKLREEFARTCFETLLKFSFLGPKENVNLFINKSVPLVPSQQPQDHPQREQQNQQLHAHLNSQPLQQQNLNINQLTKPMEIGLVNKLAVASLLSRFHEVIVKFIEDEKLNGKCPLARHRVAEITFVLKALATLISSLKRAPPGSVEKSVWVQLIDLFPRLIDCTTTTSAGQVNQSLKEVLREYQELLQPPSSDFNRKLSPAQSS